EEVAAFLEAVESRRDRVALTTAYATGLRASEVVGLCTHDIDSSRMVIHVANGKGGKQRYVMLSPKLLGILRAYSDIERPRRPWVSAERGGAGAARPVQAKFPWRGGREGSGKQQPRTPALCRHCLPKQGDRLRPCVRSHSGDAQEDRGRSSAFWRRERLHRRY